MTLTDPDHLRAPIDELPDPLWLPGPAEAGERTVELRPPGSKSLTNRALLLAALAEGESTLTGALTDADDAQRMIEALRTLGAEITASGDTLTITGVGGTLRAGDTEPTLFLNNAGTATRFLTAAAVLADGPVVIDGNARMRERPIGELVALLRELGAEVTELGEPGFVPLRVAPLDTRACPEVLEVATTLSSQYVSALLLIAPWLPGGIEIRYTDAPTSPSYVRMTAGLLDRLGGQAELDEEAGLLRSVRVAPKPPKAFRYDVEPDASGATYLWAAGAMVPGLTARVPALGSDSLQGDARFPELLERMGAVLSRDKTGTAVTGTDTITGIDADLSDMPDAAMTLAVVAACADGPSKVRGLRTLRVKETDRIAATKTELARIGCLCEVFVHEGSQGEPDEGLTINPVPPTPEPVCFDTYDDHRMAMAPALLALRRAGVGIHDPGCVRKTYARYWADLAALLGR